MLDPAKVKKGVKTAAHMYHPSHREYLPPGDGRSDWVQWLWSCSVRNPHRWLDRKTEDRDSFIVLPVFLQMATVKNLRCQNTQKGTQNKSQDIPQDKHEAQRLPYWLQWQQFSQKVITCHQEVVGFKNDHDLRLRWDWGKAHASMNIDIAICNADINTEQSYNIMFRDHFADAPRQRATLQCKVVSHWLAACTKWSLHSEGDSDQWQILVKTGTWSAASVYDGTYQISNSILISLFKMNGEDSSCSSWTCCSHR